MTFTRHFSAALCRHHLQRFLRLSASFAMALAVGTLSHSLTADASSGTGFTGRTSKGFAAGAGPGCTGGGCHSDQAQETTGMSVVISGPAFLAPGAAGNYTVTSTKAVLGSGVKMGVNIASTEAGTTLAESAANLIISNGEIVHSASAGALNTTDANGSANYSFSYTMPANASLGSAHILYAVSRLGFAGGWKHADNFSVTTATPPGAPTAVSAAAGNGSASVSFSAPASNGGAAIGQYNVTCTSAGGNRSATGTSSPIAVTSMTNGTTYSCSVTATNAAGTSAASGSASVTPQAPGVAPQITSGASVSFTVGSTGTFTVVATGTPAPTVSISGALPTGVTFNSGTRVLSGTPAAGTGGTWPVTFTASNGTLPNATQNFTLNVLRLNQSINFAAPAAQAFTLAPFNLTATATSGLTVSFSSNTPAVCSVSGSAVTFQSAGTCTIVASQIGDGTYNAAGNITQSFAVNAVAPGAPAIVTTTPGSGQVILGFTPPASNGGSAISAYTATCNPGTFTATGGTTPLTVTGLANGTAYQCNVAATNAVGIGTASPNVAVTPTTGPVAPVFTSAASKTFSQGFADAVSITASGTPNPTLALSGALPAGLTFRISAGTVPATGIISGTPIIGAGGVYSLTFTASNGTAPNAVQSFTLTVLPRDQTITTTSPPSPQFFANGPVPLAASASSGLPVVYTSATPFVCTVSGATAVMQNPGGCSISVTQPGNGSYNPAPAGSIFFTFQASPQTLTFNTQSPSSRAFVSGGSFSLNPVAVSSLGMPVSYSTNSFTCTISGTTVTMLNPGLCSITANQFGDARVLSATPVTQNIDLQATVPGAPSITTATAGANSASFTVAPPANNGGSSIFNYSLTCSDGNASQTQTSFGGNPIQFSIFGLNNGVAYTCTAKATNSIGDSAASAPVMVTPGNTANGQNLFQNTCAFGCHFNFVPSGTMLNAAGDTGTVIAYASANRPQMGSDPGVQQLSASDLAAIAAYIKQQLPPITPSTTVGVPVNIDVGSHITLNTLSFNQVEVVTGPTNGMLTSNGGTSFTYTPAPGFAGTDSFSYRGVRNDFQPPLTGDARTIMITVIGPTYFLSVNNSGGGFFGNSSRITGPGIDCGFDCSESFSAGTSVTLTPVPQAGYIFTGWSGDCSGAGTCQLTMSADRFVSANFTQGYVVTPGAGSNGSISPSVPATLLPGGTTSITIAPDPGYVASVGGTCFGSLAGNVFTTSPVFGDCSIAVLFIPVPVTFNVVLEGAQENPLSFSTTTGSGTVQVNTAAKTITYSLSYGTLQGMPGAVLFQGPAVRRNSGAVKYNATASPNFGSFSYSPADEADILAGRWYINIYSSAYVSGELRGQIDAIGAAPRYLLTVNKNVPFGGTVTAQPAVLSCGLSCSYLQPEGSAVTLTATPDPNYTFTGWTGGGCAGTGTCVVAAFAANTVTANFVALPVYSVSATAGANGAVSPGFQQAPQGGGMSFSVTPDAGYRAVVGGTCSGTLVGNTYTISNIQADCTLSLTFAPLVTVPDPPTGVTATPGNGQVSISFSGPVNNGGAAVTSYQASCSPGPVTASGSASPVVVGGLADNTAYSCAVSAINSAGPSVPSAAVNVTTLPALLLNKVVSRKMHGALGPFEVQIDTGKTILQAVSTEPRAIGNGHQIVFQFNNPVGSFGQVVATDAQGAVLGGVTAVKAGAEVIVTLAAVPDNSRATIQVNGVNGVLSPTASLGFLLGDALESRSVTAADIVVVKSRLAPASSTTTSTNFRLDVNASGSITSADLSIVKNQAGKTLK